LPAKYSAYIAIKKSVGNSNIFGPMHFNRGDGKDDIRKFWVPLHKLFDGTDCIKGLDLKITFDSYHINEKIKKIHQRLEKITGYPKTDESIIDKPPFKFSKGIAELSADANFGNGLILPIEHPRFVEPAEYNGNYLSFMVPKLDTRINDIAHLFSSSLDIPPDTSSFLEGARHAPEYVHVRKRILDNGSEEDLNNDPDMIDKIKEGNYLAQHFIDFTGDGWVEVLVPKLANHFKDTYPAYSLITGPDFFPNVDQGELMEWYTDDTQVPPKLRDLLWYNPSEMDNKLTTLSDDRFAANIELNDEYYYNIYGKKPSFNTIFPFDPKDDTITAIVSLPLKERAQRPFELLTEDKMHHTYLPDAASGVFQPGWDISRDYTKGVIHFASYGLGSPFPEDSKLCAALSSYWPAVAPDAGRTFWRAYPTVSPLTDEEIGQKGDLPWDGVNGPKLIDMDGKTFAEYPMNEYVDYIEIALQNKFTLNLTARINFEKYKSRILGLAKAYQSVNIPDPHTNDTSRSKYEWPVISFREISTDNKELIEAQTQSGSKDLHEDIYRIEIYRKGNTRKHPKDYKKILVEVKERYIFFIGSMPLILIKYNNENWIPKSTNI
jgi:hypothetical protein